jgi:hypothetical protein
VLPIKLLHHPVQLMEEMVVQVILLTRDSNYGNGGNGGTADHFSSANGGNGGTRNILNSGFSRNGNGGNGDSIDTKISELKWTIYDD